MTRGLTQLRQHIRLQKNDWVQQYFQWRIESASEPYHLRGRVRPYRVLFILSHMRSGSSLLTHIVNANPAVIGYGETHVEYASTEDFNTLLQKVYWQTQDFSGLGDLKNLRMDHAYVMDKVLHDKKFISEDFLHHDQVYALFLLREPARSLNSILDLKPHWNEQDALDYYCGRLRTLARYAQLIDTPQRMMVVTYEQMLDQTAAALTTLQGFLQTPVPFSEEYQVLKTTGMKGVGDPKGNIKAGKIVRSQRPLTRQFNADLLQWAERTYGEVSAELVERCTSVGEVVKW